MKVAILIPNPSIKDPKLKLMMIPNFPFASLPPDTIHSELKRISNYQQHYFHTFNDIMKIYRH